MRDRDKLRIAKRNIEVQAETLDEYRNTIKFLEARCIRLENELSQLQQNPVSDQSEQFYCVSSNALVYGKPCEKWCGDKNCKTLCDNKREIA